MSIIKALQTRSNSICELCSGTQNLTAFVVEPTQSNNADSHILVCETCREQLEDSEKINSNHWRCLNESMWSEIPAVQVMAWRMLNRLDEAWARDLLDMLYLDEETQAWAEATGEANQEDAVVHKDSNGAILQQGDNVVLIQDLKVKGANFTAKRGTAVRRISLVEDNPEHIEGKVEGQQIVILTKYVKKI